MSIFKVVALNTLSLSAARIINPIASLFLLAAIARSHGAAGVGEYSLVLGIFYMASNIGGLGLRTPISRAVAADRDSTPEYLGVSLLLGLGSGLLAIAIVIALVTALGYSDSIRDANFILCAALIPSIWMLHFDALFLAHHKARIIAAIAVLENTIKVVVGLGLLVKGAPVVTLFYLIVVLRILTLLVYVVVYSRSIDRRRPRPTMKVARSLGKVAPVFAANLLLSAPFARLDLILLSKFATIADVGLYSAAMRLVTVASYVPRSLKASILPSFAESIETQRDKFDRLYERALHYLAAFGCAAATGFIVLAPTILVIAFGREFSAAVPILQLLGLTLLVGASTSVFTSTLFAAHHEKRDLVSNVTRMAVMVTLLAILIPRYNLNGAGYGQVAASFVHFGLTMFFVKKLVTRQPVLPAFAKPFIAMVASAFVFVVASELPNIVSGTLSLSVFVIVLLAIDPLLRSDATKMLSAVQKRISKQ